MKRNSFFILFLFTVATTFSQQYFDTVQLRKSVEFMSADDKMGRLPGSDGSQVVSEYILAEFKNAGLDKTVWQYFTVVPDFKSVGVRNNARSYDWPVIIRAVNTVDAMTATIEQIEWPILLKITDRILAEVPNINRVCYDMSPKPSATIEWE